MRVSSQKGVSLIEVLFALGILTTGILAAAAVMAAGVQNLSSSPGDVIVTQKAAQAVEAVFAARDSHKLTWAQIRNVNGGTGSDGGVFIDGPHAMTTAGTDGLVNTQDDSSTVESVTLPGIEPFRDFEGFFAAARAIHGRPVVEPAMSRTSCCDRSEDDRLPERQLAPHLHAQVVHLGVS
jgi:Tfp pilus assembly protein PilV